MRSKTLSPDCTDKNEGISLKLHSSAAEVFHDQLWKLQLALNHSVSMELYRWPLYLTHYQWSISLYKGANQNPFFFQSEVDYFLIDLPDFFHNQIAWLLFQLAKFFSVQGILQNIVLSIYCYNFGLRCFDIFTVWGKKHSLLDIYVHI